METAVAEAIIEWKGLEWTSDQADHSIAILKRDYREVVTKPDTEAYFDVTV